MKFPSCIKIQIRAANFFSRFLLKASCPIGHTKLTPKINYEFPIIMVVKNLLKNTKTTTLKYLFINTFECRFRDPRIAGSNTETISWSITLAFSSIQLKKSYEWRSTIVSLSFFRSALIFSQSTQAISRRSSNFARSIQNSQRLGDLLQKNSFDQKNVVKFSSIETINVLNVTETVNRQSLQTGFRVEFFYRLLFYDP